MSKGKVTLLLGAGFAQYLDGLSTKNINDIFRDDQEIMVCQTTLYAYIERECRKYNYVINFESFFALLENHLFYIHGKECKEESPQNADILSLLFTKDIFDDIEQLTTACGCYSVYRHYMNLLISNIKRYNNLQGDRQHKMEQFSNFISELKNKYRYVKIYTTNYDTIVPMFFKKKIELGLKDGYYHYNLNSFRKRRFTFFSLHGNIGVSREFANNIKQNNFLSFLPYNAISSEAGDIGRINLFTPIISGYNKLSHVNGKPFNFGFQALANDCSDSEIIYTMGFSFKDTHISSILATFSDKETKIISIDRTDTFQLPIDLQLSETYDSGIEEYITSYK